MPNRPTFMDLPNPDTLPPEMADLAAAIRDLQRHRGARNQADAKVSELAATRSQRQADDAQATAKALRDGKPDPGPRLVEALDKRIAQLRNQSAAHQQEVEAAEDRVLAVIAANGAAHAAILDLMADAARLSLAASLPAVGDALDALETVGALRSFLTEASDPSARFIRLRRQALQVIGLQRVNGEPYAAGTVLDRLADLAAPPIVREPSDAKPLAPRIPDDGGWISPNG